MINIMIDCANKFIEVNKDGEKYLSITHAEDYMGIGGLLAMAVAHSLTHEFPEEKIKYFGVTTFKENVIIDNVPLDQDAICLMLRNFVDSEIVRQTSLGLQLVLPSLNKKEEVNE